MTRDEAAKIIDDELWDGHGKELPFRWLRIWEALGMLKLDEPPPESRESPTYKAYDALFEHVPSLDFQSFRALVSSAGLKIVEK